MKENLLKIIKHYGVLPQLKYFQSEVFELNEAIISYENGNFTNTRDYDVYQNEKNLKAHITEEIADCYVMLNQFQLYYGIENKQIEETMKFKIDRQLERIKNEKDNNSN